MDLSNVLVWKLKDRWLSNDIFFKNLIKKTSGEIFSEKYYTYLPYKYKYKTIAEKIISSFDKPSCIIKVRRTDYLKLKPILKQETKPDNIKRIINNIEINNNLRFATVYIMTDEKDETFFKILKDYYNIKQYFDFEELKNIEDNYELYAIETYIRDLVDYRISMFKTKEKAKLDGNFIPNYYIGNISQIRGSQ